MAQLHLLGLNNQTELKHDSCTRATTDTSVGITKVTMALKMTFYSLGEDNWNEVQLVHVMPLALVSVSHDADGIINGTIPFLMSK